MFPIPKAFFPTMFAEDVELLPPESSKELLAKWSSSYGRPFAEFALHRLPMGCNSITERGNRRESQLPHR